MASHTGILKLKCWVIGHSAYGPAQDPNQAVMELVKLSDYCLNIKHENPSLRLGSLLLGWDSRKGYGVAVRQIDCWCAR